MKKSIFRWSAAVLVAASLGLALGGCGAKDKKTASSSAFDAQKAHMSVRFAGTSDGPSAAVHTCRLCCELLPEPSISAKRIRSRN